MNENLYRDILEGKSKQQYIVDIDKFREKLGSTACDFQHENKIMYGHTIERVIEIMLDCLIPNNSFGRQKSSYLKEVLGKLQSYMRSGLK